MTMQDPLFDPWGPAAESEIPCGSDTPRSGDRDVVKDSAEQPARRWRPVEKWPTVTGAQPPRAAETRLSFTDDRVETGREPGVREPIFRGETPLVEIVLPAIRRLAHRLELARHEAIVDDRTGHEPPSVRFQIRPWSGPFPSHDLRPLPVVEIVMDADGDGMLARVWLEPKAADPTSVCPMPLDGAERGLERVLVDFVEIALEV